MRVYWLARCEGFQLVCADGTTGVVEEVVLDAADTEARALVVRVGRMFHRSVVVPAHRVETVAPFEEVLVGSGLPPSRSRAIALAAARFGPVAAGTGRLLARVALLALRRLGVLVWLATVMLVSTTRRTSVRLAPHVARGTRATASWLWSEGRSGARVGLAGMRHIWRRLWAARTDMNPHAPAAAADAPVRRRPAGRARRRPERKAPP